MLGLGLLAWTVEARDAPVSSSLAAGPRARLAEAPSSEAEALIERWAPAFLQQVSDAHPERDRPLRVDFDGDWDATNNWEHLTPQMAGAKPVVYASAILSESHAYLTYTLFYPRDWAWPICVSYVCHDNDLEVALVIVKRGARPEESELCMLETKAHRRYVAERASDIERDSAGRPWIEIESEGHGMLPMARGHAPEPGSLRFVYRSPQAPVAASEVGRTEAYEIVSLAQTLWKNRAPDATRGRLWSEGESGFLGYAGARQGRLGFLLGASMATNAYAGGVRPPWGLRATAGARGDWFLDPAFVALARHGDWLGGTKAVSLEYVYNPYLKDLVGECEGARCPNATAPASTSSRSQRAAGGLLLLLGLVSLRFRKSGAA